MSNQKNYISLYQWVFVIFAAYCSYFLGEYLSDKLGIIVFSNYLFRFSAVIGFFLVATWNVRTKHNSLLENSGKKYTKVEQRKLGAIIKRRNFNANFQMIFYVFTAIILLSANFLVMLKPIQNYVNPVSLMMMGTSLSFFILSVFTYKEIEHFEHQVEDRNANDERKKALLSNINKTEDTEE